MAKHDIQWSAMEPAVMPALDPVATGRWLDKVAEAHGCRIGRLSYVFCDDGRILDMNRQFVHHDYYTDIITFDYCRGPELNGEVFISLDTVASNALKFGVSADRELHRVIAHGLLHLCGIDDKGPGEREVMEFHENEALALLDAIV